MVVPLASVPQARVQVQRRSMVLPATPTQRGSLFLSCLDIFWQDIHYNRRVIFYDDLAAAPGAQNSGGQHAFVPSTQEQYHGGGGGGASGPATVIMQKLKSSLALCLVHYYPWCGRISQDAHPPHRRFIDCSDAGVEFAEAYLDLPLSILSDQGFQMNPIFEQLCQQPDHKGDALFSSPLLSVQATLFSDGGLALGIAHSHVVADGQSLWDFMVSWGECARGIPLTSYPMHKRERLALPNPPPMPPDSNLHHVVSNEDIDRSSNEAAEKGDMDVSVNRSAQESHTDDDKTDTRIGADGSLDEDKGSECNEDGDSSRLDVASGVDTDPLVQCVLILSDSAIKELKQEAQGAYSSYEVISAHFWQRVTIARGGHVNEPTFFTVFANCRKRLSPPLPPCYFGNVIMYAVAGGTVGKLSSENIRSTADRIHKAIATCTESALMAFIHWLQVHDNHAAFAFFPLGQPVYMASSPRFPVYEVDFGWGRPAAVRCIKVCGDGELIIFGGSPRLGQGSVEICMALPASVMKRLHEDPHFRGQRATGKAPEF